MGYNSNIHHRRSIRLKGYDYSQAGLYFITICCQSRNCLFGEISTVAMSDVGTRQGVSLTTIGQIANEYWLEIPQHFPNVVLHEHIVMPNHVHGVIEITGVAIHDDMSAPVVVGTSHGMSLQQPPQPNQNQFGKPISGSISIIVNQYKSSVKRWCNKNGHDYFKWQSRFHDHIIRNEQSYQNISEYIINNPVKWKDDKFFRNK